MNTPMNPSSTLNTDELLLLITQVHKLAEEGKNTLQLSCSSLDVQHTDIRTKCFDSFNPMLLACVAAEGIKEIYVETCKDCSTQQILSIVDAYKTLSQAMGIKLDIHFGRKIEPNIEPAKEDEPSRRTFFRTLIPSLAKHAADNIQQLTQTSTTDSFMEDIVNADLRHLSALHKLFLHALPKLQVNHIPVPVIEEFGLGNVQANESCDACTKCVDKCASEALSLRKFGNRFILEFQADCCTGCNECVSVCPQQAIEALPSISLPSLLQEKPRPLVMIQSAQ